jgi:hypothetical protein
MTIIVERVILRKLKISMLKIFGSEDLPPVIKINPNTIIRTPMPISFRFSFPNANSVFPLFSVFLTM